jgi:hypothetical protein
MVRKLIDMFRRVLRSAPDEEPPAEPPRKSVQFPWLRDFSFLMKHQDEKPGDHPLLLEAASSPHFDSSPVLRSAIRRIQSRWEGWSLLPTDELKGVPPDWYHNETFVKWSDLSYWDPHASAAVTAQRINDLGTDPRNLYQEAKYVKRRYEGHLWRLEITQGFVRCASCGWLTRRSEDDPCASPMCSGSRTDHADGAS